MDGCRLWLGGLDAAGVPYGDPHGWLTAAEQSRLAGLSAPLRRRQFLAGHWQVRALAAGFAGGMTRDWRLAAAPDGQPWLEGPGDVRLCASISHSGDWLAVAVATRAIGLDVEVPRRERDYDALARHVFAPAEIARREALAPSDRLAAFNTTWALKEAFGKRGGQGLQPHAARHIASEMAPDGEAEAFSWALPCEGALALAAWPGVLPELESTGPVGVARGWRYRPVG